MSFNNHLIKKFPDYYHSKSYYNNKVALEFRATLKADFVYRYITYHFL